MSQIILSSTAVTWQEAMIQAIREPRELLDHLQLPHSLLPAAQEAAEQFGLRVPRPFVERMEKGNLNDPLLRQVLPLQEELQAVAGYNQDPLAEITSNPIQGLIHKYRGRALLITVPHCAINCRYCFRRHFPYEDNTPSREQWQQALDYLRADNSISEVILSGGDPMAASDRQLQWLIDQLCQIPHLKRLRVHSRVPVVIPQRITHDSLQWLAHSRLQSVLVLHSNHANELSNELAAGLELLRSEGVTLLNQAVLLKGVNDSLDAQRQLSERLLEIGVLPYYLHLLDKVQGAAHFALTDSNARQLHQQMQANLPGYLVPKLTREEAGQPNKTLIY